MTSICDLTPQDMLVFKWVMSSATKDWFSSKVREKAENKSDFLKQEGFLFLPPFLLITLYPSATFIITAVQLVLKLAYMTKS